MNRLLCWAGAMALALFCAHSAAAQSGPPVAVTMSDGTRHGTTVAPTYCSTDGTTWTPCASPATDASGGVLAGHKAYTLATNGTPAASQSLAADTYSLALPSAFNGATVTVTFTANNGVTTTASYTAAPTLPPVFSVYAGTAVAASVTGGTPAGNTMLNGGPPSSPGNPQATYSVTQAATSTPLTWSVTTTTTLGPWTPQTGRPIYLTKTTTDTASLGVTVTTTGACSGGVPLRSANFSYQPGNLVNTSLKGRETLDAEFSLASQYCVTITPGTNGVTDSGSLSQ